MKKKGHGYKVLGIVAVITALILGGITYSGQFYKSAQKKTLVTLSELSDQNVQAMKKEIEKGTEVLENLAVLLGQQDFPGTETVIDQLIPVWETNQFKRLGIILEDGCSCTTDHKQMELGEREFFKKSINGETAVSDTLEDQLDGDYINVYSVPLVFKDGTKTVLYATYDTYEYRSALSVSMFHGEGASYIVKADGECVIGSEEKKDFPEASDVFDTMNALSPKNREQAELLQKQMAAGESGSVEYYGDSTNYIYYQPLGVNDWYLFSVIPEAVVEESIDDLLTLTYMFTCLCVLIFIILILCITRMQNISKKKLEAIAYVDKVTGAPSYELFRIETKQRLSSGKDHVFAMVCLNVEKFQYINDLYGFEEGNQALCYISGIIEKNLDGVELFTRMNADHFMVFMRYKGRKQILQRIQAIQNQVSAKSDFEGRHYELKITAGIYEIEDETAEIDTMTDRASMALNGMPEDVLLKYCFYNDDMRYEKIRNKDMEDRFLPAVRGREFQVYYQPKFDLAQQRYSGAEALVRWCTAEGEIISPAEFIPVFEKNGSIVRLDQYVFEMVCSQIQSWLKEGYDVKPVSVNISRLHLYQHNFVRDYLNILEQYRIPVELVELELTETVLFDDEAELLGILEKLHQNGIKILMDDFGAGFSSLKMLRTLPIDILKLDKSLIDDYDKSDKSRKIIYLIIRMAKELDIKVTAEGVETKGQYDFLKQYDCDYIQGYYCAKPMKEDEYKKLLEKL